MCRNIRPLNNFDPPATDEEVEAAAAQFVRKVAGARNPSLRNRGAFERAVADVTAATRLLIDSLVTATLRTNCAAAASTSSSVAGGSKLFKGRMFLHISPK